MDEPESEPQLNIELPEGIAEGIYSNLVMIAHSSEEFVLDFIRIMPGLPQARVKSRIVVTPQHAKRLLAALADNIDRYENTHGEIVEHGQGGFPGQPGFHFGGHGGEA
jgi:hypothetical protein